MMRSTLLLLTAALLAGCSGPEGPQFKLEPTFSDPSSPTGFEAKPTLRYTAGGLFFVRVRATAGSSVNVTSRSAPLRASIQIATEAIVTGAIYSASPLLIPRDDGSYSGVASLAWPLGGTIELNVAAAGQLARATVEMEVPKAQVAPVLTIDSPASPSAFPPATPITIDVHATFASEKGDPKPAAGIALTFQTASSASSQVLLVPGSTLVVPSNVTTDKEGHAKATLIMPNLGVNDGILYVEAFGGGAVSSGLVLTNE